MIAIFIIIGYIFGWIGCALFLVWAGRKFDDYLPFPSLYDDNFIMPILCIMWPVIILLFFIQVGCGILGKKLDET